MLTECARINTCSYRQTVDKVFSFYLISLEPLSIIQSRSMTSYELWWVSTLARQTSAITSRVTSLHSSPSWNLALVLACPNRSTSSIFASTPTSSLPYFNNTKYHRINSNGVLFCHWFSSSAIPGDPDSSKTDPVPQISILSLLIVAFADRFEMSLIQYQPPSGNPVSTLHMLHLNLLTSYSLFLASPLMRMEILSLESTRSPALRLSHFLTANPTMEYASPRSRFRTWF